MMDHSRGNTLLVFTSRVWSVTISSSPTSSPLTFRTCRSFCNAKLGTGVGRDRSLVRSADGNGVPSHLGQTNLEADDVLMSLFFDQGATAGLIDCPLSDSAILGRDRSLVRSADSNGVPFLPLARQI